MKTLLSVLLFISAQSILAQQANVTDANKLLVEGKFSLALTLFQDIL